MIDFGLSAIITGCASTVTTHGQIIDEDTVKAIQPKVHSKLDVQRMLGTPSTTGTFDNGNETWFYITEVVQDDRFSEREIKERRVYEVQFNGEGQVANVNEVQTANARNIEPSERTTKTQGQSLGLMEQMLNNIGRGF